MAVFRRKTKIKAIIETLRAAIVQSIVQSNDRLGFSESGTKSLRYKSIENNACQHLPPEPWVGASATIPSCEFCSSFLEK
jgi:hypothetical protein